MILPELLPVLAVRCYALGTAAVVAGILARNEWLKRAALVLTVLAFTTHTLLLIATFNGRRIHGPDPLRVCPASGLVHYPQRACRVAPVAL